jgi:hypothetical protein
MLPVLLSVVIKEAITAIGKKSVRPEEIANEVQKIVVNDPRLMNTLNEEQPYQSGVTWGGAAGSLTSVGVLVGLIQAGNYDPALLGPAIAGVLAGLFTLYRRWWPGLKPLFSKGETK